MSDTQLISFHRQFETAKAEVNPIYQEHFPGMTEDYSEDTCDDFAAWIVRSGQAQFDLAVSDLQQGGSYVSKLFGQFLEPERQGVKDWDNAVDREEYQGWQRADCIAAGIYRARYGRSIEI